MNIINSLGVRPLKPIANTTNFKIKMIENGTNQTKLAKEFETTKQTFNGWVTGRIAPTLNTALGIAERLNCSVEELWKHKEN